MFDLIFNVESCYSNIPHIVYYSHISTIICSLIVGFFVFLNRKNNFSSILVFILAINFSLWTFFDLILWITHDSRYIMFFWSSIIPFDLLFFTVSFYLVAVFYYKHDIAFRYKVILAIVLLPVLALLSTKFNIEKFDSVSCNAIEAFMAGSYLYWAETIIAALLTIFVLRTVVTEKDRHQRVQFLLFGFALVFFLVTFLLSNFLGSYFQVNNFYWDVSQYSLFGMVFFMGILVYLIVKFKAFNIKLIGTQALVVAQFVLIGSMFFFAQSLMNRILVGVTLVGTTLMGWYVIRSVKVEIERKEELQKISDALAIANQRLKELDLTKSEFISIASHQLRTPLTAIKGYISLLLEGSYGEVSATVQDILNKVYTVNSRLVHLVEDLLNVSRIEAGRIQYSFAPTQLEPLVAELVEMFTPTAKQKNLFLKMQLAKKSLPQLTIDPNKIKEVLSNLIDNALKYTKEGGVTVSLESAPNVARITVTDTGIGIRPEDEKNLFEKFVRTKETTKMVASGAGLGLYVGKNFVEAHGGRLFAESAGAGKGSRFIIELPLINPNIHIGTSDQPSQKTA